MLGLLLPFYSPPRPLPLLAVAGVYFDPDEYMVEEGSNVTVVLKTNVTVNKEFNVLVKTADDDAHSMYCIGTAFWHANETVFDISSVVNYGL